LIRAYESGDTLRGVALEETVSALSILSQTGVPDKCALSHHTHLYFLAILILLTNDSCEYPQSDAEDRPPIAWCVAGCIISHSILVNLYI